MPKRILFTSVRLLISLNFILSGFINVYAQDARQTLPAEILRYADSVYINATIITVDNHQMNSDPGTIVQAMAIRDEIIIGLGTNEDILRMAGPQTQIVDLQGKTVLPGIVESHVHPMGASESYAREMFKLRNTPEGYVLNMEVAATPDETTAKVARAMELLLQHVEPTPDEWINIALIHNPELGFATPADVSLLMSTPRLADVRITKEDITEIIPNYPFALTSASSIFNAPQKNIWYHVTAGPDGQPVTEMVVELK
jgi:hypothetical protein